MARASNLTICSFCGKSHAEVRKLIAGPGVYICDSCINVSKGILDRELSKNAQRQFTIRIPKLGDIRRGLHQYLIGRYRACLEWLQEQVLDKLPFLRSGHTQHEEERMPSAASFRFRHNKRYRAEISLGSYQCLVSNVTVANQMRGFGFADVSVSGSGRNRVAEGAWLQDDATVTVRMIPGEIDMS